MIGPPLFGTSPYGVQSALPRLVEYEQDAPSSVVLMHDGTKWAESARSDAGSFHAREHRKRSPSTSSDATPTSPTAITAPFNDSRHDVMVQEACRLVSRCRDLWLAHEEGSVSSSTLRLSKQEPR